MSQLMGAWFSLEEKLGKWSWIRPQGRSKLEVIISNVSCSKLYVASPIHHLYIEQFHLSIGFLSHAKLGVLDVNFAIYQSMQGVEQSIINICCLQGFVAYTSFQIDGLCRVYDLKLLQSMFLVATHDVLMISITHKMFHNSTAQYLQWSIRTCLNLDHMVY